MRMLVLISAILTSATTHAADPKFDPEAAAKAIAPFLDEETFLVAHIDLRRVDTKQFTNWSDLLPGTIEQKKANVEFAKLWLDTLVQKGGRELFVVYGPSNFPFEPCLMVPISDSPPQRKDLFDLIRQVYPGDDVHWRNLHGFLCVGRKPALDRLSEAKATPRPELAKAFASCGDSVAQMAFLPSAQTRKIFEEVSPLLPQELGGGTIQLLTKGMRWATISLGDAPKSRLLLRVQTTDGPTAQKIGGKIMNGLRLVEDQLEKDQSDEGKLAHQLYKRVFPWIRPKVEDDQLLMGHDLEAIVPEIVKFLKAAQPNERSISQNNMKQMLLACHNFASTFEDRFPGNILDKNGKPLLSWRVAILPYIEQQNLYQQFKLDEPWDSEHNKKLIPLMPKLYQSPFQHPELKHKTTYLAPLGKGFISDEPKGVKITEIADGTSHTIFLVEVHDDLAVDWTKPDDVRIDPKNPTAGLLGHYKDGFMAGMADGSVRFVPKTYSAIYALFTRNGGEVIREK